MCISCAYPHHLLQNLFAKHRLLQNSTNNCLPLFQNLPRVKAYEVHSSSKADSLHDEYFVLRQARNVLYCGRQGVTIFGSVADDVVDIKRLGAWETYSCDETRFMILSRTCHA